MSCTVVSGVLFVLIRILKDYLTCVFEKEYNLYSCDKLLVMADDQPQAPAYTLRQNNRDLYGQPASSICRSN